MVAKCRNAGRQRAANNLRVVKLRAARIGTRHKDSAHRIFTPAQKSALAGLEETRVLMQNRRKDGGGHKVFYDPVSRSSSEAFSVRFPALPVARLTIVRLADGRQESPPRILHGIEGTSCHHCIFRSEERR